MYNVDKNTLENIGRFLSANDSSLLRFLLLLLFVMLTTQPAFLSLSGVEFMNYYVCEPLFFFFVSSLSLLLLLYSSSLFSIFLSSVSSLLLFSLAFLCAYNAVLNYLFPPLLLLLLFDYLQNTQHISLHICFYISYTVLSSKRFIFKIMYMSGITF